MKIMVTGALGHIGSALIREDALFAEASELVLVDSLATQRFPSLFNLPAGPRYKMLAADVTDAVTAHEIDGCSAIVHLAAISDPGASVGNPDWLYANNLRITRHVADVCLATSVPLVFVSTTSVYSSTAPLVDESCPDLQPSSPYAKCKLQEEGYVLSLVEQGLRAAVFRLGTIFGVSPGMRFHTAVNKFCWQAAMGEEIEVWATAMDQRRPYLALSDATRMLARSAVEGIFPGEVVNAVTCDATVGEVLDEIRRFRHVRIRRVENVLMNDLSFAASTSKARGLGFEFTGSLREDVAATLAMLGDLSGV